MDFLVWNVFSQFKFGVWIYFECQWSIIETCVIHYSIQFIPAQLISIAFEMYKSIASYVWNGCQKNRPPFSDFCMNKTKHRHCWEFHQQNLQASMSVLTEWQFMLWLVRSHCDLKIICIVPYRAMVPYILVDVSAL